MDPEASGIVTGEKARSTFEKSGLPPNVLGEIWQLADKNNLGFLSQFGFCYAMRLIGYTQAGHYPTAGLADSPGPLPRFAGLSLPLLASQPTNNSLLQSQPSSLIPQNTAVQQSQPQENISAVSPADYQRFSQMFVKTTGSQSALLDGNAAKDIFVKAKLPTVTLGQIWSLVDVGNRGSLDISGFVMAMHLIHGLLSGTIKQLPPFLPGYVWQSVDKNNTNQGARQVSYSSITSQLSTVHRAPSQHQSLFSPVSEQTRQAPADSSSNPEWVVLAAQKQQMDAIFDSLDKNRSGSLSPDQVASYLMTSRLEQQDLASIWDLSDIQNTGIFNKLEFAIALFLVNRRRAGLSLPNVVPESLIASLRQAPASGQLASLSSQQVQTPTRNQFDLPQRQLSTHNPQNYAKEVKPAPKSSLDELADIFSSPSPEVANVPAPAQALPQSTSTKSDLTYLPDLPKVRTQFTSSFKPTSSFGQSLLAQQQKVDEGPSLIGDDAPSLAQSSLLEAAPKATSMQSTSRAPTQIAAPPAEVPKQKPVDYEALRSVPPPPSKIKSTEISQPAQLVQPSQSQQFSYFGAESPSNRDSGYQQSSNNDLLADSTISGQLSEATSDIANISTQVKSLTTQTSNLHEKKLRADQELTRILAIKEDIEIKLKLLRTSYANEVKQVEQVEATLATAKEETEALRSEASISEAKLNHVSSELNEKQVAVEELQKNNSALREKLGLLNAEIAEIEKQLEAKTAENVHLEKEVSVRKSQVQVAIVKFDEIKSKIADLEASNQKHEQDIQRYEQEAQRAEQERADAEKQQKELELKNNNFQKTLSSQTASSSKSAGIGAAVSAVAGAVVGGAVGFAGSHFSESSDSSSTEVIELQGAEATTTEGVSDPQEPAKTNVDFETSKESQYEQAENSGSFQAAADHTGQPNQHASDEPKFDELPVGALVDEVKEKPTEDMTGIDNFEETEHHAEQRKSTEYEREDLNELRETFREVDTADERTNRTGSTSAVTDSYRQSGINETPVTSPDNSEYRFQAGAAGVVSGLVGMPGVLVGVQRTDSLTSSVQNNASLSVRDDNIDDVSDRETLEEIPAAPFGDSQRDTKESEGRLEDSEGERLSSGVELFEIVNADEARGLESANTLEGSSHPLAQSYIQSDLTKNSSPADEEFPPIKELDYDDSSSSDEDNAPEEKFDDAVDHISSPPQDFTSTPNAPADEFDDDFNDLEPAKQENNTEQEDLFDDEFGDLKIATADDGEYFPTEQEEVGMDDHFTGAGEIDSGFIPNTTAPDFSAAGSSGATDANDEWEQLFAGFGNANTAQQPFAEPPAQQGDSSKHFAIEELVGMGFDKSVVVNALERENWNIEAATNYLLDNA